MVNALIDVRSLLGFHFAVVWGCARKLLKQFLEPFKTKFWHKNDVKNKCVIVIGNYSSFVFAQFLRISNFKLIVITCGGVIRTQSNIYGGVFCENSGFFFRKKSYKKLLRVNSFTFWTILDSLITVGGFYNYSTMQRLIWW